MFLHSLGQKRPSTELLASHTRFGVAGLTARLRRPHHITQQLAGAFFILAVLAAAFALQLRSGFTPEITDGYERVENFKSSLAVLRLILGLWRRSMYSNTSALAASSVGYVMR